MFLLDTHIWIWWINQTPNRLSSEIIKQIEQADIVAISAISCFEVTWLAAELPEHHKDPQDRIIISTAICHTSQLITADSQFTKYQEMKDLLILI